MDSFCGDKFWDTNQTWFTDDPDLSLCFERTVLVWIPCGFLWLFAALDAYYATISEARSVPWSPLSLTKTIITIILGIIELYHLAFWIASQVQGRTIYPVALQAPIINILTLGLYLFLLQFSRGRGVQSSGVQFVFWFLLLICETFAFRTAIRIGHQTVKEEGGILTFILQITKYPLICGNFLVNCWTDLRPLYERRPVFKERQCPEYSASYLSRITFSWFDNLAWVGFRKPLEYCDLWNLNAMDTSKVLVPIFEKYWIKIPKPTIKKRSERQLSLSELLHSVEYKRIDLKKKLPRKNILPSLIRAFGLTFCFGALLKVIPDLLTFVNPQVLSLLIDFVNDGDSNYWKGYFYAVLLFVSAFFQTLFTAQHSYRMYLTGMRIRTVLVSAIYKKALVVSNASKNESTVGEIVNLMSVDVQRIMDAIENVNYIWSSPLQISIALYFLYAELGPSVFSGLAVMVLMIPINSFIASKIRALQLTQMTYKDERVKTMNEILTGIKVLKLYAWEPSFQDQVMNVREEEMKTLRSTAYLNAITNFLWSCSPFLVSIFTFTTYVLVDEENVLDPQKAFVSLSLFNIMTFPLSILPMVIIMCVQAGVSITRINRYMNMEELSPDALSHDPIERDPVIIENGTFGWDSETVVLKNINLRVNEGSLVAIVGPVGSGKSSLISAMLGELQKMSGRVNRKGTTGYVAQQAWIQNATVQNNILFGEPFDSIKYKKIVQACALETDFDILPGRDQTEIGEKGINLSGGQKQRISIARATYHNADVYLLDDPLSAVDAHVGKHIFDRVIGPRGLLRKKTRVLVTHGISFLPQVDQIIVMKDGEVSERGPYKALLNRRGAFAEFLLHHMASEHVNLDNEDQNVLKEIEVVVGSLDEIRASKAMSVPKSFKNISESVPVPTPSFHLSGHHHNKILKLPKRFVIQQSTSQESIRGLGLSDGNASGSSLIESEAMGTEGVKWSVYLDYLRGAGWTMTIATFILFSLFQGFSVGANLWLSAWSSEPIVNGTMDTGKRDVYLAVYGSLGFLQASAVFVGTLLLTLGTLKSSARFHSVMLRSVLRAPMSFFDTTPVGRIVNRFSRDVDTADNNLPLNIRLWLTTFLQVVATIFIISYSTPIFMLVIFPVGILYYFIQKFYVSTSRQLKRLECVTRSPIYSHFSETLSGTSTIRAYAEQQRFIRESEEKVDHNQESYFPAIVSNRWLAVRLETVGNLVIFFAALFAVLGRDTIDAGIVGLSVSYALQITVALNKLVRWTCDVETNIVAIERIQEYVDAPQEAPWEVPGQKPPKQWPEKGVVEFQNYQTRYRDGLDLVLRNVTCKIESGEKIGILGRTGAGKSSLTLALFRIVEAAGGSLKIDGQDISQLGLHDIRGRLTIIPQDPVLFSGSLRLNLDPFGKYPDDAIWHALELAHLKMYTTDLGATIAEGGENLSVGQRQLVCLARALLHKTKLLVLDEATASMDLETDELIQKTIRLQFKDSTVITIAHRLNTIMDSTRVMVLKNGEIVEFDSPRALLNNKKSIFYEMAQDAGVI